MLIDTLILAANRGHHVRARTVPALDRGGPGQMTGLITRFGALGVFVLMVPESACIPIPSEVTLLFSGFAVHQG
jgi:hypothetical protein